MTISREKVLAAICSVRVQVDGDARLYADESGTLPIYAPDDVEAHLLTDAVLAALQEEQPQYEYALRHFEGNYVDDDRYDTAEEAERERGLWSNPSKWHVVRRVTNLPWEEVK